MSKQINKWIIFKYNDREWIAIHAFTMNERYFLTEQEAIEFANRH